MELNHRTLPPLWARTYPICVTSIKRRQIRIIAMSTMHDAITASYFRTLAVRCLTVARDCYDHRAKEELRKLADEFTAKADDLENPPRTFVSMPYRSERKL